MHDVEKMMMMGWGASINYVTFQGSDKKLQDSQNFIVFLCNLERKGSKKGYVLSECSLYLEFVLLSFGRNKKFLRSIQS